MLYTRGQAMKAVASREARAVLVYEDLANFYDSPRPRPARSRFHPAALAVAVLGSVALPWGAFIFEIDGAGLHQWASLDNAKKGACVANVKAEVVLV
jgi:hypothetical protein